MNRPVAVGTHGASDWKTRDDVGALVGEGAVRWAIATARTATDDILSQLSQLRAGTRLHPTLRRAVEATTLGVVRGLATTDMTALWPCLEASEAVDCYVRHNVPIDDVLRSVLLGQKSISRQVFESLRTHADHVPGREVDYVRTLLDDSFDRFTVQVAAEYERTRHADTIPVTTLVKRLLAGEPATAEMTEQLGYDLSGTHLAFILGGLERLTGTSIGSDELASRLERITASRAALTVTEDGEIHIWLRDPRCGCDDIQSLLHAISDRVGTAVRAAVGLPGTGPDGFRLSHRQARAAWHVGQLGGAQLPQLVNYASVETVSLLVSDLPMARSLVHRALGPLATDDARMRELRQTLRALLDAKGSVAKAALALYTHRNTVTYRARQIDALIGTDTSPLELRAALALAETVPAAVLISATDRRAPCLRRS